MSLEDRLLAVLACPIDKRGLFYFGDEAILYNPRLRRIYRVVDGRPVMLADRAERAGEPEHRRLMERASTALTTGTAGRMAGRPDEVARDSRS
jgi:uncharacterized protein